MLCEARRVDVSFGGFAGRCGMGADKQPADAGKVKNLWFASSSGQKSTYRDSSGRLGGISSSNSSGHTTYRDGASARD